jgi:hypothetical protein
MGETTMRRIVMAATCLALIACQQEKPATPEAAPTESGAQTVVATVWTHAKTETEVAASIQDAPDTPPFRIVCAKAGPTLTFSAAQAQVGMANMAAPYALVVSGATFPGALTPGGDGGPTFSVAAPLTPDLLAAVSGAETARILVNDGYAFAESGAGSGGAFKQFAADCAALTGLAAPS